MSKMDATFDNTSVFELRIEKARQLRDANMIPEAIAECSSALKHADENLSIKMQMQARNLLADIHRKRGDVNETFSQYGKVIKLGRNHNLQLTDEYVHALYHTVVFLTRIQPSPPQMFTLTDELVEVRSKMVDGDGTDRELQDYKMIQEALRRTYRRRHRLRRQ